MNIPTTGAYELDASGNFVPAIVYGMNATIPTVPTSGSFAMAEGGGYVPAPVYGDMRPSNPFDTVRPQATAPQYTPGSNQVLYGHYSSGSQATAGQQATAAKPTAAKPTAATPAAATPAAAKPAAATPAADKPAANKPAADGKPKPKTITVKAGDTLSALGAANDISWKKLYELNKGVIGGNPNLIRPGQVLKLS